jgi:hypothetical protein
LQPRVGNRVSTPLKKVVSIDTMEKGHVVDCGVPDVNVHTLGVPPGKLNVNVAGPDEGNVIVGTGEIWIELEPDGPTPGTVAMAGADVTLPVDPGDGAAGLAPEVKGEDGDEDCP